MSMAAVLERTAPLYQRVKSVIPPIEWPVFADDIDAILKLKQRAERRHPGAQLSDAGDLPLCRRHRGRQPRAGAGGDDGRCRHHRARGRSLHGGDRQDAEPGQDGADPGPGGRLLARRLDHRRRRALDAAEASRRADGDLREFLRGGEGGVGYLLHLGQREKGRRISRRARGDHAARRIPRPERRRPNQGQNHRLGRPLRGA